MLSSEYGNLIPQRTQTQMACLPTHVADRHDEPGYSYTKCILRESG
jgi:hypothetical protein